MIPWPRGPMGTASAYGAGDCRESRQGHVQELDIFRARGWSRQGVGVRSYTNGYRAR